MIRRVAERLGVHRGTRIAYKVIFDNQYTRELEPRPFDQGITRRATFDKETSMGGS